MEMPVTLRVKRFERKDLQSKISGIETGVVHIAHAIPVLLVVVQFWKLRLPTYM
jgi:hypothetical protein